MQGADSPRIPRSYGAELHWPLLDVSATQLTAQVPASALKSLGWAAVAMIPAAEGGTGGGTASPVPFSIYNVVNLSANHILLFDPYSQQLYASVIPGATQVTGKNLLVTIDPTTGAMGTPIPVAGQPDKMALSDDGQILYVNQDGNDSVARFNMLSKTLEFSFPTMANVSLGDVAVLPGSENIVAVDLGDPVCFSMTSIRCNRQPRHGETPTGPYTGPSLQFLNASMLLSIDDSTGGTLNEFPVTSTGLTPNYTNSNDYTLNSFSSFKLSGGIAFADAGGVANPLVDSSAIDGRFLPILPDTSAFSYYDVAEQVVEPDTSLSRVFFAGYPTPAYNQPPVGLMMKPLTCRLPLFRCQHSARHCRLGAVKYPFT